MSNETAEPVTIDTIVRYVEQREADEALMRRCLETLERLHGGCTDSDDGTVEAITVWCPELIDDLCKRLGDANGG